MFVNFFKYAVIIFVNSLYINYLTLEKVFSNKTIIIIILIQFNFY
jgi:hypothetical protein